MPKERYSPKDIDAFKIKWKDEMRELCARSGARINGLAFGANEKGSCGLVLQFNSNEAMATFDQVIAQIPPESKFGKAIRSIPIRKQTKAVAQALGG